MLVMSHANELIDNYDDFIRRIPSGEIVFECTDLFQLYLHSGLPQCVTLGLHDHFVRPHHLVVFMLQDVTVPDVEELIAWRDRGTMGKIEAHDDASDVARVRLDRVFLSGTLVALRRHGPA